MELTSVVVNGLPFHRMSAPVAKPAPLAVIVNPWLPTDAELGLTKVKEDVDV
jgi:hypothetical protein